MSFLSRVGKLWKEQRVKALVKAYRSYQKGRSTVSSSLLPEVGDILLYGRQDSKNYKVLHVGIYLGGMPRPGKRLLYG